MSNHKGQKVGANSMVENEVFASNVTLKQYSRTRTTALSCFMADTETELNGKFNEGKCPVSQVADISVNWGILIPLAYVQTSDMNKDKTHDVW